MACLDISGRRFWQPCRDGAGTAIRFILPVGIALSGDTLYLSDFGSHSIRAVHTTTARVGTIVRGNVGSFGAHTDGPSASARFKFPRGAAAAGSTLYVADLGNHRIRAIDLASTNKTVTTIAGSGTAGYANGAGTGARQKGEIQGLSFKSLEGWPLSHSVPLLEIL